MTTTFCVSHGEDVDGLASAALVKAATGAVVELADYADLIEQLAKVPQTTQTLYICDLGLNERLYPHFYETLLKIRTHARIVYVDHHPLIPEHEAALTSAGVEVVRDLAECTSVQAYGLFESKLPARAAMLPCMGAVTDYFENGPRARDLLARFDRDFLFFEAMVLTHAIAGRTDDRTFAGGLVDELARFRLPDELPDVPRLALEQMARIRSFLERAPQEGRNLTALAYMEAAGLDGGTVANMLVGLFHVPVGASYRRRDSTIQLSIRAHPRFGGNLGQLVGQAAKDVGGFGGGHPRASGAQIPADRLGAFLARLDEQVQALQSGA
jgi:RecJ-like exonuclease